MFDDLIVEAAEKQPATQDTYLTWLYDEVNNYKTRRDIDHTHTHLRHSGATNIRKLENMSILQVGLGSLGATLTPLLVNLGCKDITLADPDTIEIQNIAAQDYDVTDIGLAKVEALRRRVLKHSALDVRTEQVKLGGRQIPGLFGDKYPDILYVGVDNMVFRQQYYGSIKNYIGQGNSNYQDYLPELVIDCRMTLGTFNTIILPVKAIVARWGYSMAYDYLESIKDYYFDDEEGVQEDCAARSIIFTATACASHVAAFINWYSNNYRDLDVDKFVDLSDNTYPFKSLYSFDPMNWSHVMKTPYEQKLKKRLRKAENYIMELEDANNQSTDQETPTIVTTLHDLKVGHEYKVTLVDDELNAVFVGCKHENNLVESLAFYLMEGSYVYFPVEALSYATHIGPAVLDKVVSPNYKNHLILLEDQGIKAALGNENSRYELVWKTASIVLFSQYVTLYTYLRNKADTVDRLVHTYQQYKVLNINGWVSIVQQVMHSLPNVTFGEKPRSIQINERILHHNETIELEGETFTLLLEDNKIYLKKVDEVNGNVVRITERQLRELV